MYSPIPNSLLPESIVGLCWLQVFVLLEICMYDSFALLATQFLAPPW